MLIHAGAKANELGERTETGCMIYYWLHRKNTYVPADFYNYFQYGMDFLISETTHVVKKIVLHTNVVGTSVFFECGD